MSIKPQDVIRKEILMRDFLYIEIAKRHVEEYDELNTKKLIDIRRDFFSKFNDTPHNIFYIGLSESLDLYNLCAQGLEPYISDIVRAMFEDYPEVDFRKSPTIQRYMEDLLPISEKYDIFAPDVLYPIDMISIIEEYTKSYCPPPFYRFSNNKEKNFNVIDNSEIIEIIPNTSTLNESDIDAMKYQIIIKKILNTKGSFTLSTNEQEFMSIYEKGKTSDKFRIDSFIKLIFGMLFWDTIKAGLDTSDVFNIYAMFFKKINHKICDASCIKEKHGCARKQTCQKFIRESFRITSLNIKDCTIYHSKSRGIAITPNRPQLVPRYPISNFRNGDFPPLTSSPA